MLYFLKQINLLEDLPFRKVIFHITFLYGLDSDIFPSEFVYAEGDLPEGTLTNQFHEFVVFQGSRWQFVILLDVGFYELYQSISFLEDGFINFSSAIYIGVPLQVA